MHEKDIETFDAKKNPVASFIEWDSYYSKLFCGQVLNSTLVLKTLILFLKYQLPNIIFKILRGKYNFLKLNFENKLLFLRTKRAYNKKF